MTATDGASTASLALPSMWPDRDALALGTGLAAARTDELACDVAGILLITASLSPGQVVEHGTVVSW